MRIAFILLVCLGLAACARPVGDLGRAQSGVMHNEILPTAGKLRAMIFKEPVSHFNWTDQEIDMHNRAWRFLVAPHSYDWFFNVLVEWQRTRLAPPSRSHMLPNRYYEILRWERYRSSRVRYNRVSRDIDADLGTIPTVFRAFCNVVEVDRQRHVAAQSLSGPGSEQYHNVRARHEENTLYIDWFVAAVDYRYHAYQYALEGLLVETPHEEARLLDARLSEYAIWVDRAKARDFCAQDYGADVTTQKVQRNTSRYVSKPFSPDPNYRK